MKSTMSLSFIQYIATKNAQPLPEQAKRELTRCIEDYCGCMVAGRQEVHHRISPAFQVLDDSVDLCGVSDGLKDAFYHAFFAHYLELDDGHRKGMLHLAAPIISSVFSGAEQNGSCSESDILHAIACGYETAILVAEAMQPEHKLLGYHATGTCGTLGAAIAVGILRKYTEEQLERVLCAATTMASGLLEMIDNTSEMKAINAGQAAMNGLMAAEIGRWSLSGPLDPMGGKRGFFAVLGRKEIEWNLPDVSDEWKICEVYHKPYAACRHCHPAIEGILAVRNDLLKAKKLIEPEDIANITIHTYRLAIGGHDHIAVSNASSAKMSIPYTVAAAILYGLTGLDAYQDSRITDDKIQTLMNRVHIMESEELTRLCPDRRGAELNVQLVDGQVYHQRVLYPLGEPENPMSDEALNHKTEELLKYGGLEDNRIHQIIQTSRYFETEGSKLIILLKELQI